MPDNAPQLKVRQGDQIFGPMNAVQIAELLAAGRIDESATVSADGTNWQSLEDFFAATPPDSTGWSMMDKYDVDAETKTDLEIPEVEVLDDEPHVNPPDSQASTYGMETADADRPPKSSRDRAASLDAEPIPPPKKPAAKKRSRPQTTTESDIDSALRGLADDEATAPTLKKRPKKKLKRRGRTEESN